MDRPLDGVVITGAGSGIGRALALAYADPGRRIALIGRRREPLEETAALVAQRGAEPFPYPLDVRDDAALDGAAMDFAEHAGPAWAVIANAGLGRGTLTAEPGDRDAFRTIMEVNWLGTMYTFSAFLPYMKNTGRLVGVASVAGFRGLPGSGAYSASKAAAITYLESLRLELAGSGLRVVTICPGFIDTPMTRGNPYPMPWLMDPDKAASRMRRAIDRGQQWLVLPRPMAAAGLILRYLPHSAYAALFRRFPRKPRRP